MSLISEEVDRKANRQWVVSTAPSIEPVTVDEVKTFGRIDGSNEDTLISGFIKAVREAIETYLGRALIRQTIKMIMDWWPDQEFVELPQPPLISISSVQTIDEEGATTDYDSDNYYIITEAIPGRLVLKNGVTPPQNTDRYYGGYVINYIAGYGSSTSDIPQQIREAMKLWVMECYENRAITTEPPPQAKPLLDLYRVIKY